jgi:hypothetical protein
MVLCEIDALGNPMVTYLALSCLTLTSQMILSGGAFLYYYGERQTYMRPPDQTAQSQSRLSLPVGIPMWTKKSNCIAPDLIVCCLAISRFAVNPTFEKWQMKSNPV